MLIKESRDTWSFPNPYCIMYLCFRSIEDCWSGVIYYKMILILITEFEFSVVKTFSHNCGNVTYSAIRLCRSDSGFGFLTVNSVASALWIDKL